MPWDVVETQENYGWAGSVRHHGGNRARNFGRNHEGRADPVCGCCIFLVLVWYVSVLRVSCDSLGVGYMPVLARLLACDKHAPSVFRARLAHASRTP